MSTFQRILVYAEEPSRDALEHVVALAERHDARVSVCDVIASAPELPEVGETIAALKSESWQRSFERLRDLCSPFMSRVSLDYVVLTGNRFIEVTREAIQQHSDLVVHISSSAEANAGLNPVGMHLVRKCPATVWSMPAESAGEPANVVVAIDRDLAPGQASIIEMAVELAVAADSFAPQGSTLHVVHAWEPYSVAAIERGATSLSGSAANDYFAAVERDYARWFEGILEQVESAAPDMQIEPHLVRGSASEVVPRLARDTGADLIVMGTIGTNAVPGVLIGTTAEAILSETTHPVVALKPANFRTPLKFNSPAAHRVADLSRGASQQ